MDADTTTAPALDAAPWLQFICDACGLVYDEAAGDPDSGLPPGTRFADIPDDWACPICGVGKADFSLYAAVQPTNTVSALARVAARPVTPPRRRRGNADQADQAGVLIVGAGRAGWQVAQALRERDAHLPITLVSACAGDVYDKPLLSVAVARGLAVDRLVRETAAAAAQRLNVRLLPRTAAVHVDVQARSLRTSRGPLRWQHLVLAHGAEPALPAVLPAALVWRVNDLQAYTRLRAALAGAPRRLVIVGAGLVGCELANDLALAGHRITLLDQQARPLAAQVPPPASERLLAAWAHLPIRFVGGVQVTRVERLAAGGLSVRTATPADETLEHSADAVIAATGLRTANRLARSAGLAFDAVAGGIVCDAATGATSQPSIYALGDCAVVGGVASRYIEPIARQAQAIAQAITATVTGDATAPATTAPASTEPVLRVKTGSMPITVAGRPGAAGDGGRWVVDRDDASALQMHWLTAAGTPGARLTAGPMAAHPPSR